MDKIRNLSIKKTIVLYMFINLLCCFLLSALVVRTAEQTQQWIWLKYIDMDKYFQAIQDEGENYEADVPRIGLSEMSQEDSALSELCDFLETYSIVVISFLGTVITVALFYRNKIKVPLSELEEASRLVSQNQLDFTVAYKNEDEMGQLCREFEKMREQLAENNKNLWGMIEQERILRAAVAHDIRAPLAVMKGYQEMLLEFVPEQSLDKDKIVEMLKAGMQQIERMDNFTDTMRKLSKLEERSLKIREIVLTEFAEKYRKNAAILSRNTDKDCSMVVRSEHKKACFDEEIVTEVMDNLLINGLRYADKQVKIVIAAEANELRVTVSDDGGGFPESTEILTKAYYHVNPQDDLNHFGLGLYLSRLYCEKHGGRLLLGNQQQGGGNAIATFHIENID